jgi:hypothetical protein
MGSRQPSNSKPATTAKQQVDDRLAQALRDNLHRRKAQLRARANSDTADAAEMPMTAALAVDSDQNKQ